MATQLYDKNYVEIYPVVLSNSVMIPEKDDNGKETQKPSNLNLSSKLDELTNNHESDIKKLEYQIAELTGDKDTVSNLIVEIKYSRWNTDSEAEVTEKGNWQNAFLMPTAEQPYIWKKTTYSFKGDVSGGVVRYEIVASDVSEKDQTIYIATASTQPTIDYQQKRDPQTGDLIVDDQGNPVYDLTKYDYSLPTGWTEYPQPISPSYPYSFISNRKRVNGKWEKFSDPAQFGKWSFDSQLEIRYTITEDGSIPNVNKTSEDPGANWTEEVTSEFIGKLWMITATSVNNALTTDTSGNKWRGPNLMAIIQ